MTNSNPSIPDPEYGLNAALAEYEALRAEIAWLIEHSVQLQNFAIGLAVGIFPLVTFFLEKEKPAVLVGVLLSLPIALSLLGALYFRQHQEVYVVASYINEKIRPLICELSGRTDMWTWEEYKQDRLQTLSSRSPIYGAWTPAAILILRLALFILPAIASLILAISIALSQGMKELNTIFTLPGTILIFALGIVDFVFIAVVTIRFARESNLGRILLSSPNKL